MVARARVFFVHEPVKRDAQSGQMIPMFNIRPAAQFGDIVFALPGRNRPPEDPEACLLALRDVFRHFRAQDYLAVAGDLQTVIWAAVLACRALDRAPLKLLKWDRQVSRYILFEARP